MRGLRFEASGPAAPSDPNRVDVALFVGLVARRPLPLSDALAAWLEARGWYRPAPSDMPPEAPPRAQVEQLLDVPVPIDSWDTFDALYAWDARPITGDPGSAVGTTYLGAAVRSFFAQGGRRCFVVSVGDPPPFLAARSVRAPLAGKLIPGYHPGAAPTFVAASPEDRTSWRGVAHLFGLPDVTFVCLPDLSDLLGADRPPIEIAPPPPPGAPQVFTACSTGEQPPPADVAVRALPAPMCDRNGYGDWKSAMSLIVAMLQAYVREAELVAAVPMPTDDLDLALARRDLLTFLRDGSFLVESAFLQLTYPWLRSPGSSALPDGLESPDAVLVGLLARNALLEGTYRNAARLPPPDVYDYDPKLPNPDGDDVLETHVSRFGETPDGLALLSDVTTSGDESYRQAPVSRLLGCLLRAARLIGEDVVFDANDTRLWRRISGGLDQVLSALWRAGALDGAKAKDAYTIRCDASTMTQDDLDAGRVIAEVSIAAALGIDRITVLLTMSQGGASLAPGRAA